MADRMNIKFTIQAVDRFTTVMKRLDRQLDALQRKADRFDLQMKPDVDLNTDEAFERMNALERRAEALSRQINKRNKIDVDVDDAKRNLNVLERSLMVLNNRDTINVDVDTRSAMGNLRRLTTTFSREALEMGQSLERALVPRRDYEIRADFSPVLTEAARARRYMGEIFETRPLLLEADIDVDTGGATARVSLWRRAMDAMLRLEARMHIDRSSMARATATIMAWEQAMHARVLVNIAINNYNTFRRRTASLATNLRNMGEIFQGMGTGLIMVFSSILSPLIASTTGMVGSLGVMIGVTAGATMGLMSSFVGAGIAAGGFAAIAIPSIKKLHEAVDEIGSLEEKIEMAKFHGNAKQAAKYTAELNKLLSEMSPAQKQAADALGAFKTQFNELRSAMEPGVLTAYAGVLTWVTALFEKTSPMIEGTVAAVNNLTEALNINIESADMQAFFEFLNTTAATSLETIGKALGNFIMGFLNMMVAFGPLAQDMQGGFLEMSEGFRKWTSALGENKKFQAFVEYTRENWPKVKEIIGDAIAGIIELFAGFAPYASDWMDTTRDMLNSFRDFAQGLGENQQFQDFLNFIKANAPAVTTFVGNIVKTLVELGIAMAPVGVAMLDVANSVLEWIQNFRQANPVISNVIIWIVTLIGAFILLMAPVLLAVSVFTTLWQSLLFILGPIGKVLLWADKLMWGITKLGGVVLKFLPVIGQLISRFIAFLGPIGLVISIVIALAIAIYANWGTIGPWIAKLWDTIKEKTSMAWAAIKEFIVTKTIEIVTSLREKFNEAKATASSIWEALKLRMLEIVMGLVRGVILKFVEIVNSVRTNFEKARETASSLWEALKTRVVTLIQELVSSAKAKFEEIVSNIRSKFEQAKAVATGAWESIKNTVSEKMQAMVTAVVRKATEIKDKITDKWNEVMAFLRGIDLSQIGADIIRGLIGGITSMAGELLSAAKGVVEGAIGAVKGILRSNSPSKVFRDIGVDTMLGMVIGIDREANAVIGAVSNVADAMTSAFSPKLEAAMNVTGGYENGYTAAGNTYSSIRAQQAKAKESRTVVEVPVYLNGKEIAKASNDEQNRMNQREEARKTKFSRTGGLL